MLREIVAIEFTDIALRAPVADGEILPTGGYFSNGLPNVSCHHSHENSYL
jgi:hypothetical protein